MPLKSIIQAIGGRGRGHSAPEGMRVYAVGDIHGRLDLVERLLETIEKDRNSRPGADALIVFLGDLVDRGPDSRGVVERLLELSRGPLPTRFLIGNHELVFLKAARGDPKATRFLVRIGGQSTLLSYGITPREYEELDYPDLTRRFQECVPAEHIAFLSSFENWIELGDYLFVHAGLRPNIPIEDQEVEDLCWIRDEFLRHRRSFGKMVVHGHSITDEVDLRPNRIGIDTGAYYSGRLTALVLEGDQRRFLST